MTETPDPASDAGGSQQSRALKSAVGRLGSIAKPLVLDMGPAVSSNITFFSRYSCKVCIDDLHEALGSPDQSIGMRKPLLEAGERFASYTNGQPLDLVVAWDLLNYLQPDELEALFRSLRPHLRRGTRMLAVVSTRNQISATPLSFVILDEEHLRYGSPSPISRPGPRYAEADLLRMMPGFEVESSLLLRNGMLEYLMVYSRP